ncbi:MAG TPA: rRNA maturation RNase YbeY [Longimicrobium sp.]
MDDLIVEVSVAPGVSAPVQAERLEAAVRHVLGAEGIEEAEISVALLDDAAIAAMNEEYLEHEGPTDVITFAMHEGDEPPLGDIYVGVEQAARQAAEWSATPAEEVLRLAVHGTLHVLGYEHPEGAERVESEMFIRQEELLRSFLSSGGA